MDQRPILVVEDDGAVRRLITECLRGEGFTCVAVGDAESALEAIERANFAAALVDNHLPGMRGVELVRHLGQTHPTLPVVLVTGDAAVGDQVRGLDAGAADYIVKPFDPDTLVAHVRAHLRRQDAWGAALEEELHRRAGVVRALAGLEPGGGRAAVARAVCDAVMASGELEGVGVALLGRDESALSVVASQGILGGGALARHLDTHDGARRLRTERGPWLEPLGWGEVLMACAPMATGPEPIGVLVLVAHDGDGMDPGVNQWSLAAAGDFARMAARMLALAGGSAEQRELDVRSVSDDLAIVFQPIVDLRTGTVQGVEALARFADGVPPAARFAAAATSSAGPDLEVLALERAVGEARRLPEGPFLAVNVSARAVVERHGALEQVLGTAERPVVLELTEHDPVGDYGELRAALARLAPAMLAVDDAGAGFASLRHVLQLEPDFIKLDRSWVAGIDADPARQALVAGIAHLSRVTGAVLIAEGLESEQERAVVEDLGATLGQGYLLGRPASVADGPVTTWAATGSKAQPR